MSFSPFTLTVPATSANLGPGFDTFGMALNLANHYHVSPAEVDVITIDPRTSVATDGIAFRPAESLLFQALEVGCQKLGYQRPPVSVSLEVHIPLARGLGSSSSVIVAGLRLAAAISGQVVAEMTLARWATELEGHPDNVVPALLGGVCLCDPEAAPDGGLLVRQLPWPPDWRVGVVIPPTQLMTKEARRVLPQDLPREAAIFNLRKSALLTYALMAADCEAMCAALADRLHHPYRAALVPAWVPLSQRVPELGGFGAVISGAGPTVAVFYPNSASPTLEPELEGWCHGNCFQWCSLEPMTASPNGDSGR